MKIKSIYLLLFLIFHLGSCQSHKVTFDENLKKELFNKLNAKEKTSFSYKNLSDLLSLTTISGLQQGAIIEKEFLFEDFKCNCNDKMTLSYDKEKELFVLLIYEESYEKGLDWCPESSYSYSFRIVGNKVTAVKKAFIAG